MSTSLKTEWRTKDAKTLREQSTTGALKNTPNPRVEINEMRVTRKSTSGVKNQTQTLRFHLSPSAESQDQWSQSNVENQNESSPGAQKQAQTPRESEPKLTQELGIESKW